MKERDIHLKIIKSMIYPKIIGKSFPIIAIKDCINKCEAKRN